MSYFTNVPFCVHFDTECTTKLTFKPKISNSDKFLNPKGDMADVKYFTFCMIFSRIFFIKLYIIQCS